MKASTNKDEDYENQSDSVSGGRGADQMLTDVPIYTLECVSYTLIPKLFYGKTEKY